MIEESVLQSNFIGRDGFRWWIGQIPPEESHGDQINQTGDSWGNRLKVRIMGYHPQNEEELKNEDLPWAQILLGATDGSGGGGLHRSVRIVPGDSVFGFFLDGDDAQLPVILGTFGRAKNGSLSGQYQSPFVPFTGYTGQNPPSKYFLNTEIGDQSGTAQTIPAAIPKETADKVNEKNDESLASALGEVLGGAESEYRKVLSSHSIIGKEILLATAAGDGAQGINKIFGEIGNLVGSIQDITKGGPIGALTGAAKQLAKLKIGSSIDYITSLSGGVVKTMMGNFQKDLAGFANSGLKILYDNVFGKVFAAVGKMAPAKLAGTNAQAAFIGPLKSIFGDFGCVINNVIGGLGNTISTMINGLVDNVSNFVTCVAEQFVGGLVNSIIGHATNFLKGPLSLVSKILGLAGFPGVGGVLRKGAEALAKIANLFKCDDKETSTGEEVQKIVVGLGPAKLLDGAIDAIMEVANTTNSLAEDLAAGVQSLLPESSLGLFDFMNPSIGDPSTAANALGNCYAGPPLKCAGIEVNLFGSNGTGATARAILGDKVGDAVEGFGSIIGFDVQDGGSGYTSPPFVEIKDTCKSGYGAIGQAIIDYDDESDTFGQVIDIVVVSGGGDYPVNEGGTAIDSDDDDVIIDNIVIVDPGFGYDPEDTIVIDDGDDDPVTYTVNTDDSGRITSVTIPSTTFANTKVYNKTPRINIRTSTGFGAIVKPRLAIRPDYQGEVKQSIDCIS